jgi:glycosyltransferase involved in cell wall biosynthesis
MKTSVALASFNGEKYIALQLRSLIDQTRRPDEIIVSDGGSTDDTISIVERFKLSSPVRIELLKSELAAPIRPPKNFERALEYCSGDIVFCCDQDDYWYPQKVERVCGWFSENPGILCVMNDAQFADELLNGTGKSKLSRIRSSGLSDSVFVMGCCAAFRRDFLKFALPVPDHVTHDGWLLAITDFLDLTLRNDLVLQDYRIHSNNVSKGFRVNLLRDKTSTLKEFRMRVDRAFRALKDNEALLRELLLVNRLYEKMTSEQKFLHPYHSSELFKKSLLELGSLRGKLELRRRVRMSSLLGRISSVREAVSCGSYGPPLSAWMILKDLFSSVEADEEFILWKN